MRKQLWPALAAAAILSVTAAPGFAQVGGPDILNERDNSDSAKSTAGASSRQVAPFAGGGFGPFSPQRGFRTVEPEATGSLRRDERRLQRRR